MPAPPQLRGSQLTAEAPEALEADDLAGLAAEHAPAAREPEETPKPKLFEPPEVEPGDVVMWRNFGASGPGVPAVVTRVNADRTLALSVFEVGRNVLNALDRESVLHKDDPRFQQQRHYQTRGSWFLSPREQRLRELLGYLSAEVRKLKQKTKTA